MAIFGREGDLNQYKINQPYIRISQFYNSFLRALRKHSAKAEAILWLNILKTKKLESLGY
jgi:hypothetical protein